MEIDPSSEAKYRVKLSNEYLKRAKKFLTTGDWKESAEASQLSAENAAKAIIAIKRIPSWTHDPSHELKEIINEFSEDLRNLILELASIVHELAPEHILISYGKPDEGLTPWDIYNEEKAKLLFNKAKRANEIMNKIIKREFGYATSQ